MHQGASTFPFNAQGLVQHLYENSIDINIHSRVMNYKTYPSNLLVFWQKVSKIFFSRGPYNPTLSHTLTSRFLFPKPCATKPLLIMRATSISFLSLLPVFLLSVSKSHLHVKKSAFSSWCTILHELCCSKQNKTKQP